MSGEEEQARITTYEEAFKRIKEATGVSDTQVGIASSLLLREERVATSVFLGKSSKLFQWP